MRSFLIILDSPRLDQHFGFEQAAEDFPVEQLVAQLVVKALNVAVFPRAARRDIERLDRFLLEPVLDGVGDELRPIVAANMLRAAIPDHCRFHHGDDILGPDRPSDVDG